MSYPRNMAGAVALLASSSLLGLGCMVATDGQDNDADDQSIVADDVNKLEEQAPCECAVTDDGAGVATEATGESKDALWFGGYGRRFGGYGFGYGRRFGGYGFGYGRGFGGYGYPFYGYGGYGYPFYGYGYPFYGYGGYGCGC